ncbi:MAG TPA: fasciclin domain-containing protein [Acidisoma sp.]|jgi:uncharacterized surface protein with fasciclin (FAS1) repeats|uniref:fasciclin domain-containing protein n=1 Tax=Acidisoma sp. TaxID=1872115 RepID=UPI002CFB924E|nr:fasciclin domain-containing protein [Acidisoma sp.]HTI03335.1 fasciclin domain-containing protein [Acidisoma sp.]
MNMTAQKHKIMMVAAAAALVFGGGLMAAPPARAQNAVSVMASNPQLSEWMSLVQNAGLGPAAATNQYTVFALTNDGFDKLNAMWRGILKGEGANKSVNRQRLQAIVRSQAVFGLHPASEFAGKVVTLQSVAGTPIVVDGTVEGQMKATMAYATGHQDGAPLTASNAVIYPIVATDVHQ